MRDDILRRLTDLDRCPEDVQGLVLRLPDGTLSPEEEERALDHVAQCESCRYMLEFYGEYLESMESGAELTPEESKKKPWLEIPIQVAAAGLNALGQQYIGDFSRAHVLSEKASNVLEFNVPFGQDAATLIRIIRTGARLTLEVAASRPQARYYIMSGNDFRITSPVKGIASFEGLPVSDMLVSEDMKRFVKISVEKKEINMNDLESKFNDEMLESYQKTLNETGYRANYFLRLVNEMGGLAAAKKLLGQSNYPEGLTKLWELKRLDLSLEAIVISDQWISLFTDAELQVAKKRLKDLGYLK